MYFWKYLCSQSGIAYPYAHGNTYFSQYLSLEELSKSIFRKPLIPSYTRNISPKLIYTKSLYSIAPLREVLGKPITHFSIVAHIGRQEYKIFFGNKSFCFPNWGPDLYPVLSGFVITCYDYIPSDTNAFFSQFWISHNLTAWIEAITIYMSKDLLWNIELHKEGLFLVLSDYSRHYSKNLEFLFRIKRRVFSITC